MSDKIRLLCLYTICGTVVVAFVNMYELFTYLRNMLGSSFMTTAPLVLPAAVISLLFLYVVTSRKDEIRLRWIFLISGLIITAFALAFPDPEIPVKRIHVTEYALLSLLVRYTMSFRHKGAALLVYSIFFTSILGIHDEFLQGIHAKRTYGLKDMGVNILSAIGSGMILHGCGLFNNSSSMRNVNEASHVSSHFYLIILAISLATAAFPLIGYLGTAIPLWPFMPLAAAFVFWSCFVFVDTPKSSAHMDHGISAITMASLLFLLYPVITNVFQITFR